MKFLVALIFIALVATAYMGEPMKKMPKKEPKYMLKKRMCVCIKKIPGFCLKLRCCEIYLLIPEKVMTEKCKFGPCKFEKKEHKKFEKYPEKKPTFAK